MKVCMQRISPFSPFFSFSFFFVFFFFFSPFLFFFFLPRDGLRRYQAERRGKMESGDGKDEDGADGGKRGTIQHCVRIRELALS